jgi:hypothetical protein
MVAAEIAWWNLANFLVGKQKENHPFIGEYFCTLLLFIYYRNTKWANRWGKNSTVWEVNFKLVTAI